MHLSFSRNDAKNQEQISSQALAAALTPHTAGQVTFENGRISLLDCENKKQALKNIKVLIWNSVPLLFKYA